MFNFNSLFSYLVDVFSQPLQFGLIIKLCLFPLVLKLIVTILKLLLNLGSDVSDLKEFISDIDNNTQSNDIEPSKEVNGIVEDNKKLQDYIKSLK